MPERHLIVPYPETNSTTRARGLHWVRRLAERDAFGGEGVTVHGPGFASALPPAGQRVVLLRNARRVSRGRIESRVLRQAALGIYDLDDGLPWDDGRLPGLGRWWKRPFPRSLVARRAASATDRVIAGNEILADWARAFCADVRLIPTCVEPSEYDVRTVWDISDRSPVIGWIGSAATEPYIDDIADVLAAVSRRTGARLHIISSAGSLSPALRGFTSKATWTPASTRDIASWDVGIMPMRDGVYERAKCGYKLLQYAASGLPSIGSPVGVNAKLLREIDGLAPRSKLDWTDALVQVIEESPDRRMARAQRGLSVVQSYSYEQWEPAWLDAVGW